jgi:maltooligosyltrehalose trehalohydrolase
MLFMGEEFFSTTPFLFFTDHHDELGKLVTEGRRKEFAHFAAFSNPETREKIPDPNAATTFHASIPTPEQNEWFDFYKTLLGLRRSHIVPRMDGCTSTGAQALSQAAVRASWNMNDNATLTIATNFGAAPIAFTPPPQTPLFTTTPLPSGMLPPFTTSVWLDPP